MFWFHLATSEGDLVEDRESGLAGVDDPIQCAGVCVCMCILSLDHYFLPIVPGLWNWGCVEAE